MYRFGSTVEARKSVIGRHAASEVVHSMPDVELNLLQLRDTKVPVHMFQTYTRDELHKSPRFVQGDTLLSPLGFLMCTRVAQVFLAWLPFPRMRHVYLCLSLV